MLLVGLCLLGLSSAEAALFHCRSYNEGSFIVADTEKKELTVKDRFGNELDVFDGLTVETIILMTGAIDSETFFMKEDEALFILHSKAGKTTGTYKTDSSYQCREIL